jgi:M6 family metalloprotease-like protein
MVTVVTGPAAGQDIEVRAAMSGRQLPEAYYHRIRNDPGVFQITHGWIARREAAARVTGTLQLAVIQALFADSPEPSVSADEIQRVLFDGPTEDGTVTEFYHEMSGGRLTVTGTAADWVRTDLPRAIVVGASMGLGLEAQVGPYLVDALSRVDDEVDFRSYDNDGPDGVPNSGDDDGIVDAVAFQFLEIAASCGGPGIWPHRSRVSGWTGAPFETSDPGAGGGPILVDDYIIQSALDCGGVEIQNITTIAHELGHVLGLPDFYDSTDGIQPEQRRWVMGCWSLMAGGAWGCGTGNREAWTVPTHMSAFEKITLGWMDNVQVVGSVRNAEFTLAPVVQSEHVLRIPLNGEEYFLVEYRAKAGFDRNLPSEGVLIYHVDVTRPTRPCATCEKIYFLSLEEADGDESLKRTFLEGGDRGTAGDAFAHDGPSSFTGGTLPSTHGNSGTPSNVSLYRIVLEEGVARLRLSTTSIPLDRIATTFLTPEASDLTAEETEYLDAVGNANGTFDLGDFRRYVLDHPSGS